MNQATSDTDSGKPLRRLPRPRLLSVGLALAGATVIVVGILLQGSAPAVDPTPPPGYGSLPWPSAEPVASPSLPVIWSGSPDGGLLPDPSTPAAGPTEPESTPRPTVPVMSGALGDLESSPPVEPVRLVIPALGVDAPIQAVGVTDGEMQVPPTADVVAWYRFGPAPGEAGSSVLAAHVSWGGELGVFYRLRDLPQGAEIEVRFADGSIRLFRAFALAAYDKQGLPSEQIFRREGAPMLTLITCGGDFNPSIRRFTQNIVAYAVPLEEPAGGDEGSAPPTTEEGNPS